MSIYYVPPWHSILYMFTFNPHNSMMVVLLLGSFFKEENGNLATFSVKHELWLHL